MAKQLLGKEVTAAMNEKLQAKVAELKERRHAEAGVIRCGENPSDLSYEKGAMSRAALIGVEVERFLLPEDVTKEALIAQIEALNADAPSTACAIPAAAEAFEGRAERDLQSSAPGEGH